MKAYKRNGVVGGAITDLDYVDGALLDDRDFAIVLDDDSDYIIPFELDSDSGVTDNGYSVIAPLTNAGTKRWIRRGFLSEYDVRSFGAVGNGTTDDSDAIEAAINSGLKRIEFSNGDYRITRAIILYRSNIEIVGYNARITQGTANTHGIIVGQQPGSGDYIQVSNISVRGLTFIGYDNGSGSTYSAAITVRGPATNPYVESGGCNKISIENCIFDAWCIGVVGTNVTDVYFSNNTCQDMFYHSSLTAGGYGLLMQTCYNIHVVNNIFRSVTKSSPSTTTDRHGVYISVDPARSSDANNVCKKVYIAGNDFLWGEVHNVSGAECCLAIRAAFDVRVEGNSFYGGYGGVVYNSENASLPTGVVISNNTFRNTFTNGVNEQGCINVFKGSGSYITRRVSIIGNTCEVNGTKGYGIQVSGADIVNVSGNVISSPVDIDYGILFNTDVTNLTVGPNTISPQQANCLTFSGVGNSYITVHRQHIKTTSGSGVKYKFLTYPTNLKFAFVRSFLVTSDGSGSITLSNDDTIPAASVSSDAQGFVVTLDQSVDVHAVGISVLSQASSVGNVYLRSKGTNTITFGITNYSGVAMPAASNAYAIQISIPY